MCAVLFALGVKRFAAAQLTTFRVLDYPGAKGTLAFRIRDAGNVVGHYKVESALMWFPAESRSVHHNPVQ